MSTGATSAMRDVSALPEGENAGAPVVAECLCLKLRMVARATAQLYDKALQPVGLSSSQFSALRNIHRFVPLGISGLAKVMLLERTTLTRNLEILEGRGLLALNQSSDDARISTPVLTPLGLETLMMAAPRWRMVQRRFFGGLGASGWADLLTTLRSAASINEQAPYRLYVDSTDTEGSGLEEGPGIEALDTQRCANSTLRGAARYVTRDYDGALRTVGLKSTQLHVLAAIEDNAGCRPLDLATRLSLDQATVTLTLSSMRRAGWVETKAPAGRCVEGAGSRGVRLSTEGRDLLARALPAWRKAQSAKLRNGPTQALMQWGASIDNALVAALKAQIV